ncbi:MAG: right-handed parallel beta-helix repeat-containing protein [Armatimonadota bacterium]
MTTIDCCLCMDAGIADPVFLPDVDFEGQARVQGSRVDIGADESDGLNHTALIRRVYVNTAAAPNGDGASWATAYRKIGDALADVKASGGAEVWVAAGIYSEKLVMPLFCHMYGGFTGNETDRSQRNASVNETAIDAAKNGTVITAANSCTIDGFTIRNAGDYGIVCNYTSPTISNNKITGCYYSGISVSYSSPVISNNAITGNYTYNYYWAGSDQGGIRCDNAFPLIKDNMITNNNRSGVYCTASSPTISNNTINGNSGSSYYSYGGIYCDSSSAPTISGNTINSNGNHGILCENSSSPKITGNTLEANASYGIGCYSSSTADINDNTLTSNVDHGIYVTASSPNIQRNRIVGSARGIGAYTSSCPTIIGNSVINNKNFGILLQTTTGTPSVVSNIVGFNNTGIQTDDSAAQITNNTVAYNAYDAVRMNGGTPVLVNNILAFNLTGVYRTGGPIDCRKNNVYSNRTAYVGLVPGVGDMAADPLFACDKIGDLHIQANSPCRDVGGDPILSTIDVDGQERIQGAKIDLGADESDETSYDIILRVIYVDVTAPLGGSGTSWATAYRKIADALEDVKRNGGAEIWVSWGNYSENLTLPPFAHLYGGFSAHETAKDQRDWSRYEAIIDGGNKATTITSTNATTIDGFTIRNGSGYGIDCSYATCTITHNYITGNRSGAVYCSACSPTIVDSTVTQNGGWGVYCTSAHPLISGNELTNNSSYGVYCTSSSSPTVSKNNITGHSYGVMCDTTSNPKIDGNTIKSNGAYGVYCSNSSPAITKNTISANGSHGVYCNISSAPIVTENIIDWNGDHGVYCSLSSPSISMNRISSNSTGVGFYSCTSTNTQFQLTANTILNNRGWGIYLNASPMPPIASNIVAFNSNGIYSDSSSIITNNTITGNTGQGINLNGASPSIYNNIVANNGSGIVRVGGRFAAFNSDVFGNGTSYTGMEPGVGDISTDPMFASYAFDDFRLKGTSPCRNKGTNNALNVPDIDFVGGTRIEEGIVDIGADEYNEEPSALRQLYVDTDMSVSGNGLTWQTAYRTITEAIEDVKRNWLQGGAEIWVAAGLYTENVSLVGGTMLYGGFAGNETQRNQRNWVVNETIIDGGNKNHTVVGVTGSIIDGFTVRNGSGCGFYCPNGSPTISNNKITANRSQGIYCYYSSPYIASNTITANSGHGVQGTGSQARLVSNIIGKHTGNYGAYWDTSSAATLINNTIAGNYFGVVLNNSSTVLSNNIIAFNSYYGVYNSGNGVITPTSNCVYGQSSNYLGFTDPNGTQGNISVDPVFVDQLGGDYHLTPMSPCKDSGDNVALWPSEIYDVDAQSRIVGTKVDIGGDEYSDSGAKTQIAEVKRSANGTYADVDGAVVTAAFPGFFYIQAEGTYCGVRVDKPSHGQTVGKKVRVYGLVGTNSDKELVITASFTQDRGTGVVKPIAMPNKSIGGGPAGSGTGQVGVANGVGLNNIGVLATTFGKYTYVNAQTFKVDDGSGVSIKCIVPAGVSIAPGWNYVSVTGVVSCEMVTGEVQRLIRVRSASDIMPR